ncbi:MAG: 50S ribosomal protein L18e [Candidatus Bathyarchaeia archaeon]|nr:50S ribosomal protein L18e [Candidatus Bathyarchaeia archaeon]MDI6905270.1 50S ribosomal protein L18e [Candidatus Bathyarchaeia archaeon]
MKKVKTTNPELVKLIRFLKKQSRENKSKIWRDVAERLAKPRRKRIAVNVSRLNRYTEKNETVVIPGKVLGAGEINHPITVAAFTFSEKAKEKIRAAKGKCLSFFDLVKKNPKGSNVKIIG